LLAEKEIFKKIKRIQIAVTRDVNDLFAGMYRSAFKGRGLEFEEVREYQPGDDIRSIDWNVTAKLQHPYVKIFREERELTVMLLVDVSASSLYSHTSVTKSEWMAEMAALLAFSAIKNNDKVGLLLFTDHVELYIQPKKGLRHVLRVIRELLYFKPKHTGTDIRQALNFLGQVQKKRAICFIISDFLATPFELEMKIAAKRHEMIAIQLYDSYERDFPSNGLIRLEDLETGEEILADSSATSENYRRQGFDAARLLKQTVKKAGASLISISTGESYSEALFRFFRQREKR
jgi:uncharacterized protein (DUF58 family)